ncbi:MAG: hypothetical protein QXM86_04325 [Candidatus Bathyarchaeia archaeon]
MNKTDSNEKDDAIRWQLVKAMLDEFPSLRVKAENYLEEKQKNTKCR